MNSSEFRESANPHVPDLKVDSLKYGIAFALVLTAVQRLVGLARSILLCRLLPEEQLGQWSLTWSYLMLLAPLAVLGLPGSFGRYVEHYRQRGQLKSFLTRIALISALTTGLFSVVMLVFSDTISLWMFRDFNHSGLVWVMAMSLVLIVAFNCGSSLMEALRQVRLVTLMRFISGLSFAVLAIGMIFVWQNGAEAVTIGFALSCLIGLLPAVWFLLSKGQIVGASSLPLRSKTMWARVAPFAAWLWVINIFSNLYELADRNMLLHLAPVATQDAQALVGQYHSGRILPLLLVSVAAMLAGILMPYMTANWEGGDRLRVARQLRWTLKLTGLAFTLAGLVIVLLAPLLFETILQGKYNSGWSVLPLTLVYCIWYSLATVGQDYLWCREKGKWACLVLIIGLIVNVALNLVLIPRFGLTGAVWATASSNIVCLIALYRINQRFGWRPDAGVWLVSLVPLCVLLPTSTALVVFATACWGGCYYGWIFDKREMSELRETLLAAGRRLGLPSWRISKQEAT